MSSSYRHAASALVATTVAVLPVALFGGIAPLIREELGFEAQWIGAGVAVFFGTSALASVHGGRLGEHLGSQRALWLGIGLSAAALSGLALLVSDLISLLLLLAIGGLGNAIIQPAANLALARGVSPTKRGFAFGFKQAGIPAASGLGGFAVGLAVSAGWRMAFGSAVALALVAAVLPGSAEPQQRTARGPVWMTTPPRSLWLLTIGIGLGAAAANSMSAYLVEAATVSGWNPQHAGTVLGIGSVLGIATRLGVGWYSDRMESGRLKLIAAMAGIGAGGYICLAFLHVPFVWITGAIIAFAFGWGYNGLFLVTVVRLHPDTPASATGYTQIGAFGGAVIGPPLFGQLVSVTGYTMAWPTLAILSALAALMMLSARRRVHTERAAH